MTVQPSAVGATSQGPEVMYDEPRRLRLVPELPDGRSRRALTAALERHGLTKESAVGVARAVVNPEAVRSLLDNPTTYRVPGAELLVIRAEVYTTRVIADATNPRILNAIPFPAALNSNSAQGTFTPLDPPVSRPNDFSIVVESLEQLIWQLGAAMKATVDDNTPRPPLNEQGVMEPPLAVPARIEDEAGTGLSGTVLVREGSTRVSHAQAILGVNARDVVLRYRDDREQTALIAEINAIARSPKSTISPEQAARVRVATMPMDIVIGVLPDDGGDTTLGEAVSAKVAQDHLNHKKQWDEAAKDVHLGESCLIALHAEMLLTDEGYGWLSGRLSADQHDVDGRSTFEDDRWTELAWLFTTKKSPESGVVRRAIANVRERDGGRAQVRFRRDRVPLAVALAMRARRGAITGTAVERETKILEAAVPTTAWDMNWSPTTTSITDLVEAAIDEAETRTPGVAGLELAIRAIWYLSKNGQLRMPRNDLGAGADRRSPEELIVGMLASVRGVRQLGRVIEDGRAGEAAALVGDDQGTVVPSGTGAPVTLTDERVRNEIVPKAGPPVPPARNPREEFLDAVANLARQLHATTAADDQLRQIDDGHGSPMYDQEGIAPDHAEDLLEAIADLKGHIDDYVLAWRLAERMRRQGGMGPQ